MEAAGSSDMLLSIYQTTWHDIPKDTNLHIDFCGQKGKVLCRYQYMLLRVLEDPTISTTLCNEPV
jgi:hypothetical protein